MPCRTDDDSYSRPNHSDAQYNALKKEADNVTRMLCSVMTELEKYSTPNTIRSFENIDGLKSWWEHHKEIDRKRIAKEVQDAEKALGNLSKEAIALLVQKLQNK